MESKHHPKLEMITQLGQGGFGSVYKVRNASNKKIYILKKILIKEDVSEEEIEKIMEEASILSEMKGSENIVKIFDSFMDTKDEKIYFNIVLEYCEGLDLRKFINDYKSHNHPIPKYIVNYIIKQIINGLKEIHKKNLIHRDLKPENIFITNDFLIKIGDFGITKQLDFINKYANTQIGTLQYMAPEVLNGEKYNQKVDIWSLGCIIYELCCGNICFKGKSILELASNIIKSQHGTIDMNIYGEKLQKIIDKSLIKNYKDRADIDDILDLINDEEEKFIYNFLYNQEEQNNEVDFKNDNYEPFYDIDGKVKGIVVMDLGSCYCRAGFRGQEKPATCFPSCFAKKGDSVIWGKENDDLEKYIKYPIKNLNNGNDNFYWDEIESLYNYIFYNQLRIQPEEQIIITTKFRNLKFDELYKVYSILFEYFNVSGLYVADQSLLSLISKGRYNGIVIDVGYNTTKIVPIFEGSKLSHAITTLSFGGNDITKEGFSTHYLPDGKEIKVDDEWAIDTLLKPSLIGKNEKGIGEALINSIEKCDKDLEKNFYENIHVSGGIFDNIWINSKNGFNKRIIGSLNNIKKIEYKDIICIKNGGSPFYGGNILSYYSFFNGSMYVTKEDWEEYGFYTATRKCFDSC